LHLENIRKKSGVEFSEMIFFDDDSFNVRDVATLGVISILTPDGVTREVFQQGLASFAQARGDDVFGP
jgi:magnesium-dependent phosphatase 1